VFHVELRRFPNVARLFNLGDAELRARILLPWVQETPIELDDRRWVADEKTRLTIYEGPEIPTEQRGLGRGWANAQRDGEDVTAKLLGAVRDAAPAAAGAGAAAAGAFGADFKQELVAAAGERPLTLREVVLLTAPRTLGWRPSQRLGLAEEAVWELLHQRRLTLSRDGDPLPAEEWQSVLLNWEQWADPEALVRLRAADRAAPGDG
jgi:hypothetical protein